MGLLVHLVAWALLILAIAGLGGASVNRNEKTSPGPAPRLILPPAALARFFDPKAAFTPPADTNGWDPFFTLHFIPKQAPPAPPPTTRKIDLTYLGYYQTDGKARRVMVRSGTNLLDTPVGTRLTANLFAAEATMQTLVLTNPAAQTNTLALNLARELEVPIK